MLAPTLKYDPRKNGADCDNCILNGQTPVPAKVVANKKLVVLGEAPGGLEVQLQENFVGQSGQRLNAGLKFFGVKRSAIHINNAVQCKPHKKLSPGEWKSAIACCKPRLLNDLSKVKPKFILAAGKKALLASTGKGGTIKNWVGILSG